MTTFFEAWMALTRAFRSSLPHTQVIGPQGVCEPLAAFLARLTTFSRSMMIMTAPIWNGSCRIGDGYSLHFVSCHGKYSQLLGWVIWATENHPDLEPGWFSVWRPCLQGLTL